MKKQYLEDGKHSKNISCDDDVILTTNLWNNIVILIYIRVNCSSGNLSNLKKVIIQLVNSIQTMAVVSDCGHLVMTLHVSELLTHFRNEEQWQL